MARTHRTKRSPALAGLASTILLLSLAACGNTGGAERPPASSRPSAESSADRTSSPRASRSRETATSAATRTTATTTRPAEPARTTEPARTAEPARPAEPARTTEPARTAEPAPATEPVRTAQPAPTTTLSAPPAVDGVGTAPATSVSAASAVSVPAASVSAVPVSAASVAATEEDGGLGLLGWLLMIGLFAALLVLILISRSRRVSSWQVEASALAAETRTTLDVRLPPVLDETNSAQRAVSWPPVRDDLAGLGARWADLSSRAPETAGQASAAQAAGLLHDLVTRVDIEGEASASEADRRLLRRDVNAILDALAVALAPQSTTAPPPPGEPGAAAYR